MRLKHLRSDLSVVLVAIILAATCAKQPPTLPPELVTEWKINEVVVAIGTLQRTAIALNAVQRCKPLGEGQPKVCQPLFSNANTRLTIRIVESTLRTIEQLPAGWKATANAGVDQLVAQLDAAGKASLTPYIEAARAVINALVPGGGA